MSELLIYTSISKGSIMANDTKVTLCTGGEGEHTASISKIIIPDLWHIARAVRACDGIMYRDKSADQILEVWHLAHDLKNHIREECP